MDLFKDNSFTTKKIDKGTILLSKGGFCKYAYLVIKGCLISYVMDNASKEHIIQFAPEEWIISDMDSFINNKPTCVFIKAIEDTEVILLDKIAFNNFETLSKNLIIEQSHKLIRNNISMNRRLISLLSYTAEEKYKDFLETYPTLFQRLPLKLIASYIGVTPEYLSEVRRKIANK